MRSSTISVWLGVVRGVVTALALWFGGLMVRDAIVAWRGWHEVVVSDPSAADLYRTNFEIDVAILAFIVVVLFAAQVVLAAARQSIRRSRSESP